MKEKSENDVLKKEIEDKELARITQKRLKEMDPKDNIPFDEAIKLAGWKE